MTIGLRMLQMRPSPVKHSIVDGISLVTVRDFYVLHLFLCSQFRLDIVVTLFMGALSL